MNTPTKLDIARDQFLNELMETDYYKQITSELHVKYGSPEGKEDYPEEYWNEFNDRYDDLVKKVLNGQYK